jgi:hypothetical protein
MPTNTLMPLSQQDQRFRLANMQMYQPQTHAVQRIWNYCRRQLNQTRYIQTNSLKTHQTAILQNASALPPIVSAHSTALQQLQEHGIFRTTLEALNLDSSCIHIAQQHIAGLQQKASQKHQICHHLPSDQILQTPELYLWGLQPQLLALIENYLQIPPAYHGIYLRRDLNNRLETKTRRWHIDMEDHRILKVIIYLNDVDETTGPFQYLDRQATQAIQQHLNYRSGYLNSQAVERIIPSDQWHSCLGKAGSVTLVDTARLIHRGKVPTTGDRYTLFYDYTSRQPKQPYYCKSSLNAVGLSQIIPMLDPVAIPYVLWRNQ